MVEGLGYTQIVNSKSNVAEPNICMVAVRFEYS